MLAEAPRMKLETFFHGYFQAELRHLPSEERQNKATALQHYLNFFGEAEVEELTLSCLKRFVGHVHRNYSKQTRAEILESVIRALLFYLNPPDAEHLLVGDRLPNPGLAQWHSCVFVFEVGRRKYAVRLHLVPGDSLLDQENYKMRGCFARGKSKREICGAPLLGELCFAGNYLDAAVIAHEIYHAVHRLKTVHRHSEEDCAEVSGLLMAAVCIELRNLRFSVPNDLAHGDLERFNDPERAAASSSTVWPVPGV